MQSSSGKKSRERADSFPQPLSSIETKEALRLDSGLSEVNRVLGGGIMKGSVALLAGEPGIGKSTLMLQLAAGIQSTGRVLDPSAGRPAGSPE